MKRIYKVFFVLGLIMTVIVFCVAIKLHNQEIQKAPINIHEERPLKPMRTPSPTLKHYDGSYIIFEIHHPTVLKLYDSKGEFIPDIYYVDAPPGAMDYDTSAYASNTIYFAQPETGTYKLELSGSGSYSLYSQLTDLNANSFSETLKGTFGGRKSIFFTISFDKENWKRSGMREGG